MNNIPLFFTDARMHCANPNNQTYRPLVSASFAIDYWLGKGLHSTFYFHLSTFIWYVVQCIVMFFLYLKVFAIARPACIESVFCALCGELVWSAYGKCRDDKLYLPTGGFAFDPLWLWQGLCSMHICRSVETVIFIWSRSWSVCLLRNRPPCLLPCFSFTLCCWRKTILFGKVLGRKNFFGLIKETLPAFLFVLH